MTDTAVKYFFVGVGKCGTSWIYEFLRRHNIIATPSIKEPYLVNEDDTRRKELIRQLYNPKEGQDLADFSNVYYWDYENAAKILQVNPQAKIIVTVRMPSERIKSHFGFLKRNALVPEDIRLDQYLDEGDSDSLVKRSEYAVILDRYVTTFGRENVLLLPLEMLKYDPQNYADILLEFLECPKHILTDEDKSPVLAAARARVKWLAKFAKWLATILRSFGLLSLLGYLKRMKLVRKILYRPVVEKEQMGFGKLSKHINQLDETYVELLRDWNVNFSSDSKS